MASVALGAVGISACLYGLKTCGFKIPVRVSCWFCSHKQVVSFGQRNSFDCLSCGQYNGFAKDGDYNKEVKGQLSEHPKNMDKKFTKSTPNDYQGGPSLCDTCNRNQDLKMHQLRQFEPRNLRNEDKELEEYTAHLEQTYRLCRQCEAKVRQVIGEQDSKLKQKFLAWKLSLFRKSPLISSEVVGTTEVYLPFLSKLILIMLSLMIWIASLQNTALEFVPLRILCYIEEFIILPQNFTYFELVTVSVPLALALGYCQSPGASIFKSWLHLVNIFTWLALFGHRVLEWDVYKCELATLCLLITFCSCFLSTPSKKEERIEKKRDKRRKLYQQFDKIDENEFSEHEEEEIEVSNLSTPAATPISTPLPPSTPISTPMPPPSPAPTTSALNTSKDVYLQDHEIFHDNNQCDISTLQINAEKVTKNHLPPLMQSRPQSPFSIKNYNNSNKNSSMFVKPARFVYNERKRVAQSSWVAGGYWQTNDNLSRSSSQSSGIGSLSSAQGLHGLNSLHHQSQIVSSLPNSRVNSTCGEIPENLSIFSEPAYKHGYNSFSMMNSTLRPTDKSAHFRSTSQLGDEDDRDSLNSSFGRMSQEAFSKLRPKAESSPIEVKKEPVDKVQDVSFLERKITIDISMYSLLLFLSVGCNLSLIVYLFYNYVWH